MVSTRRSTKSRELIQEDVSSGDIREDYDPGECSGPASSRSSKSKASINSISKQNGKQPRGRRSAGRLPKLPVVPLDILYEVIYGLIHIADEIPADVFTDILSCPSSGSITDILDQQSRS